MSKYCPVAGTQSQLMSSDTEHSGKSGASRIPCLYKEHTVILEKSAKNTKMYVLGHNWIDRITFPKQYIYIYQVGASRI